MFESLELCTQHSCDDKTRHIKDFLSPMLWHTLLQIFWYQGFDDSCQWAIFFINIMKVLKFQSLWRE